MTLDGRAAHRILVVDDDRLIREMVRDALQDRARVESCESAEAALEALRREPADLVLSDQTMPGMSGDVLLRSLRKLVRKTPQQASV